MMNIWHMFKMVESEANAEWLARNDGISQTDLASERISDNLVEQGWATPEVNASRIALLKDYRNDLQLALNSIGLPLPVIETDPFARTTRTKEENRIRRYRSIVEQLSVLDSELSALRHTAQVNA